MPTSPANSVSSARTPNNQLVSARYDEHRRDGGGARPRWPAGPVFRRSRRPGAAFRRRSACRRGGRASDPISLPSTTVSRPWPSGRTRRLPRARAKRRPRAIDIDAAIKPRVIEQDGFLRQPAQRGAGGDIESHRDLRVGPVRAIDLLGRSAGHHQAVRPTRRRKSRSKRSPPAMPPAVLTITASHSFPVVLGKRMRSEPSSSTCGAAGAAVLRPDRDSDAAARAVGGENLALRLLAPPPPRTSSARFFYSDSARRSAPSSMFALVQE